MSPDMIAELLLVGRQLRRQARWSPARLEAHQARALSRVRRFARRYSPFYGRFHAGLEDASLAELPILTRAMLVESYDSIVTDPAVRLADARLHARVGAGERYLGRYHVVSSGREPPVVYDQREWTSVLASYARGCEWGGVDLAVPHRMRLALVSPRALANGAPRVEAMLQSRVPTLRIDASAPPSEIAAKLGAFQPDGLVVDGAIAADLADAQLAGRLRIAPRVVLTAGDPLSPGARARVVDAWSTDPFDAFETPETALLAAECPRHRGLHLLEDLTIVETVGDRLVVTLLFARTLPLIRYQLEGPAPLAVEHDPCPCGRPFRLAAPRFARALGCADLTPKAPASSP